MTSSQIKTLSAMVVLLAVSGPVEGWAVTAQQASADNNARLANPIVVADAAGAGAAGAGAGTTGAAPATAAPAAAGASGSGGGGSGTGDAGAAAAPADQGGLSDNTKQGIGCLVTAGSALTYTTFVAGASESLIIVAGGLLAPSATPTLWLGLLSTLTAATCGMGAAATPIALWAIEQSGNIGAHMSAQVESVGTAIAGLPQRITTAAAQTTAGMMAMLTSGAATPTVTTTQLVADRVSVSP